MAQRIFRPLSEVDWLNQVAHVAAGLLITGFLFLIATVILPGKFLHLGFSAIPVGVMMAAIWREIVKQHPDQCGEGCRTDLLGWLAGIALAVGLAYYIINY